MDQQLVHYSKKKLILLVLGAVVFVAIGLWMLLQDAESLQNMPPGFRSLAVLRAVGVFSMTFFAFCGVLGVRKFFDKRPGLILDATGFTDNSSLRQGQHVAWSDISDIKEVRLHRRRLLALKLIDPERFIAAHNPAWAATFELNMKLIGAPLAISPSSLDIGFADLRSMLVRYWTQYR